MGVTLGVLTTKDGRVIPLPTAADEVEAPEVETERRKEELRFSRCRHNVISGRIWGEGVASNGAVISYDRYRIITEDLRRKGETMVKDVFKTKQFALFRAFFLSPNVPLDTKSLAALTGVNPHSVSVLLQRPLPFLLSEGLIAEKPDPRNKRAKIYVFKATCDNAEEEAKLWYVKMLNATKKPAAKTPSKSQPQAAAPKASGAVTPVQVDTATMEAIIRVPLDKLALVLKVIS